MSALSDRILGDNHRDLCCDSLRGRQRAHDTASGALKQYILSGHLLEMKFIDRTLGLVLPGRALMVISDRLSTLEHWLFVLFCFFY